MDPYTTATSKTAASAPSTPGLFSPSILPQRIPLPPSDGTPQPSPYLHPLQMHKVRETHKAMVEQDFLTGRKLINQYEVIEEIGRGVHGKVKLARSLETSDFVAIKIIQRFSKKRRLGKVTVSPETKTKREIAILKKIRHPHVVGLLEVIDDADAKKIYMILEHVELGEIAWRKKGSPRICAYERRRIEGERRGEEATEDDEKFFTMLERRRIRNEAKRAKTALNHTGHADYWSLEHGDDEDDGEALVLSRQNTHTSTHSLSHYRPVPASAPVSRPPSRAPSNAPSRISSRAHTPLPIEYDIPAIDSDNEEESVGPLPSLPSHQSLPSHHSASALEGSYHGSYHGSYSEEPLYRGRSPSMADSIISHMSSVDDGPHDAFEEDYSYVPCFTMEQARSAFRDTVLGLEYLHYEGIVHRDIKPANLLWTKDHRVKISDFGVSYFGRPIREGETEENVSEADAADFDDDLELAKTVGTPAFFAPELCYTDLDIEQPKITEQIDVWSLGVTLYCLIFARIPFLADDEYKLFRSIAKDEAYIPKRRLKAVNPSMSTSASTTSLGKRIAQPSTGPYREEGELAYEYIDDELLDLLRRMLVKDPTERMKLREVKRHPWVIKGIDNIIGWLDDTDPSRKTEGRRIQVDDRELERAVVPLTLLERARSALKKTVNKVIGATRSETRVGEGSRKRAISSATSSGTDTLHTPTTPDGRRASLRGDESYFLSNHDIHDHREPSNHAGHPLSQSLTASRDDLVNVDPLSRDSQHSSVGATPKRELSGPSSDFDTRPGPPDRENTTSASIQTVTQRGHAYSKSVNNAGMSSMHCNGANTPGPFTDHFGSLFFGHFWHHRGRDQLAEIDQGTTSRARSVDRSLFESDNKHSEPSLALSDAVAPGTFEHGNIKTYKLGFSKSEQASPAHVNYDKPLPSLPSPLFFEPQSVQDHQIKQTTQSASTPSFPRTVDAASNLDQRPATAHKIPSDGTMFTPPPRTYGASTPESFRRARETLHRRRRLEQEAMDSQKQVAAAAAIQKLELKPVCPPSPCPPSPDDELMERKHEDAAKRAQSYSSVNSTCVASPSDATSPVSSLNLGSQEKIFPSVPSLPALISAGSSVSADTEGDFMHYTGVNYHENSGLTAESTPDTITTPPSISKHSTRDSDVVTSYVTTYAADDTICLSPDIDDDGYAGDGDTPYADDDSDSDEGLTMTTRKKSMGPAIGTSARRGTNNSAGSTETAKKVIMES